MTPIAEKLERKLKTWEPSTAQRVEKLVEEIIERTDAEKEDHSAAAAAKRKMDPLFADTAFYEGDVPPDLSLNHDKYLYDEE